MDSHNQFLDLLPSYVLGALDGDDLRRLEQHLEGGCEQCDEELYRSSQDLETLADATLRVEPSEHLRARILRAATQDSVTAESSTIAPRFSFMRVAAAVTAIVLTWSLWTQIQLRQEMDLLLTSSEETGRRLEAVRTELDVAQSRLRRTALATRIVASPRMRSVVLAGLEGAPQASAQTLIDPEQSRAVFYASHLAPANEGTTYQLWFIAAGTPVSAGIFDVDPEGNAVLIVEQVAPLHTVEAWAVTVEPAGGVPQPTGEMVLKG